MNAHEHEVRPEPEVTPEPEPPQVIEEGPALPAIFSEDFLVQFAQAVGRYKRWIALCYRMTHESHWLDHGKPGSPHYALQGPGAEALMESLGINFEEPHISREELGDGAYAFWCEGYMESRSLGGRNWYRRGWYIGYCDSHDQFFNARPGWNPKTGQGDVKKAAYTNWIVNGVTRIAGLRDPDPATLKAAGLDLTQIRRVEYARDREAADATFISDPQRNRLFAIAKAQGCHEGDLKAHLETLGITSTRDITRGRYNSIVAWVEGYQARQAEAEAKAKAAAAEGQRP